MPQAPSSRQIVEKDALYYPYIHIRSVDWLKRALLIFPHVARIVPRHFALNDSTEIRDFASTLGRWDRPLLTEADLRTPGVYEAQQRLLALLSCDLENHPDFRTRFGKASHFKKPGQAPEFVLTGTSPIISWFVI